MLTKLEKGRRVCIPQPEDQLPWIYLQSILEEAGFVEQTRSKQGDQSQIVFKGCLDLIVLYLRFEGLTVQVLILSESKWAKQSLTINLLDERAHLIGNKIFDKIREVWQKLPT